MPESKIQKAKDFNLTKYKKEFANPKDHNFSIKKNKK